MENKIIEQPENDTIGITGSILWNVLLLSMVGFLFYVWKKDVRIIKTNELSLQSIKTNEVITLNVSSDNYMNYKIDDSIVMMREGGKNYLGEWQICDITVPHPDTSYMQYVSSSNGGLLVKGGLFISNRSEKWVRLDYKTFKVKGIKEHIDTLRH